MPSTPIWIESPKQVNVNSILMISLSLILTALSNIGATNYMWLFKFKLIDITYSVS